MSDSFATLCTIACQAPLSMGFPRQGYWSGLPGDLGIKLVSSALVGEFFTTELCTALFCFPPSSVQRFQILQVLTNTFFFFNHSHPDRCAMIPTVVRNKARLPTLATSAQHSIGSPSQSNYARKKNKEGLK